MTTFLIPPGGGIQPINGRNGSIVSDMATADRGKPGKDIVVNPVNQVIAGTGISMPMSNCDPQSQLQRQQQQIQQQVQQKLEQQIIQNIQQAISQDTSIQNLQQQLQNIQQQSGQGQNINSGVQQQEIVNKEMEQQIQKIIVGAVVKASQQMPNAVKVANSVTAGLKPVASVAESLSAFVPSQGINMSAYGTQKTIQTVSQACSF